MWNVVFQPMFYFKGKRSEEALFKMDKVNCGSSTWLTMISDSSLPPYSESSALPFPMVSMVSSLCWKWHMKWVIKSIDLKEKVMKSGEIQLYYVMSSLWNWTRQWSLPHLPFFLLANFDKNVQKAAFSYR